MRCVTFFILSLMLLTLLPLSGQLVAAHAADPEDDTPLRIGVGLGRPPFSTRTSTGSMAGFDVDIAQAICREMNRPCLLIARPLSRMRTELEQGELDMVISGMAHTPEDEQTLLFSSPYYRMPSIFVAHKNGMRTSIQDGGHVATQTGSIQEDYLHARSAQYASVRTVVSSQDMWDLLLKGEVDAVLFDGLLGFSFLFSPQGANFELAGSPVSPQELPDTSHIALPRSHEDLRNKVDAALQAIRRNGVFTAISRNYFPFDVD